MGERGKNRDKVEQIARRLKEHNDAKGGGMSSSTEAHREAAEVARKADAQKEAGALANPNKGRAKQQHHEEPRKIRKGKAPRIFIDYGRKG